jgi:lipocalin-like protein
MNSLRYIGVAMIAVLGLALLPVGAVGQEKSLKEQLIGTWLQVSIDGTFPDGTKRQLFGPNPKGIAIYTRDGYFSLMQSRAELTKLESSNRATATAEEAKAVVAGSIAYFGKYSVDEAGKVITIDIQGSTFANQIGSATDNKRIVTSLTANELKLTNPGSASGLKLELVFRRAN